MWVIKDVIEKDKLIDVYNKLINEPSWYLSRGSNQRDASAGTFPGMNILNGDDVIDSHWLNYFESLLPDIDNKCRDQYGFGLPENLLRIHLVAKQENANAEFHIDIDNPKAMSLIGMLSPVWEDSWGGEFYCNDEKVNHSPGSFILIKSNQLHNGLGPRVKTPYWRIIVNYILI